MASEASTELAATLESDEVKGFDFTEPSIQQNFVRKEASTEHSAMLEIGEVKGFDFTELSIRQNFIRKVSSLLMCQLLITLSFITFFVYCKPVKEWAADKKEKSRMIVIWVFLAAAVVCFFAMACCECVRRKSPMNLIFLGIFTIVEGFLLGVISCKYDTVMLMIAIGTTAAICFSMTLFALQTKWDLTCVGMILHCAIVLLIFGICAIFLHDRKLHLLYSGLGTFVFSFCLVIDIQLMISGDHKYSISPEEYIFAALTLYLDIINIFIFILSFGRK